MKTNKVLWISVATVVVLICVILLLVSEAQFPNALTSSGIVAIISAVLGVILTVAVTTILLNKQDELQKDLVDKQSEQAEKKEKQVKVFEKKQEIYHAFLNRLQEIIQDGEVKIGVKRADGSIDMSVDKLKDLFFQLGYLQMHSSDDALNIVLDEVAKIIQNMNDFATDNLNKQNKMPEFYAELFAGISTIVAALKKDLYQNEEDGKIEEKRKKIENILRECGLFVETAGLDKYEIQKYFWDELQNQLIAKGYQIEKKDFANDINKYYDRPRKRHRYYALYFDMCKSKQGKLITFKVEIENKYYYGFPVEDDYKQEEEEQLIRNCIQELGDFSSNSGWCGWKWASKRYELDFWKLDSKGFEEMKDPRKRENFIKGLADEIDGYIKRFKEIAKEKDLID